VKVMVVALGAEFERESGFNSDLNFGTAAGRATASGRRIDPICDVVRNPALKRSTAESAQPASATDLLRPSPASSSATAAPKPDISTPGAFVRAMLAAPSVAWTDPKAGGRRHHVRCHAGKARASLTPSTEGRAVQRRL